MQQSTTDLLGGKRREPGPLKPWVMQPQPGIGRVDRSIARHRVGNQYALRGDDLLRLALIRTPKAGAREDRHVSDQGLAAIKPHLFTLTVRNGVLLWFRRWSSLECCSKH